MKRIISKKLRRRIMMIPAVVVVFFVLGAAAPFMFYPKIEKPDAYAARAIEMHRDKKSPDRALIIETNSGALDERIRLMNTAEKEIIIATYDLRDGESTRDILAMALHKADSGVKVRLLADGISGLIRMRGSDLFRALAAHENIEMRIYNMPGILSPWKWMGRMHDKYLIVDNSAYILGGRNMFDYFIGDYPTDHRSHDREVLIFNSGSSAEESRTSSLFQLLDYFESMWNHPETTDFDASCKAAGKASQGIFRELENRYARIFSEKPHLFDYPDYASMTEQTNGIWLLSNPTGLYAKQPAVFHQLYEIMKRAERDIIIHSPYAVLNGYMASALSDIANTVPLSMMVNAVENGDNIVASSDYTYRRSKVLKTGAKILEYAGGESYHGKSIAIDDDISIIGSFNMDLRSAYVDTELMLLIRSEEINRQLRKNMDALHRDCRQITPSGEAIIPDHLSIPDVPFWKKAVWHVMGLLLQPFRCLV